MEKQPNTRSCFLCGKQNEVGLKMSWYNDNEAQKVVGKINIPRVFNGYPGIVHGGIVAALLDETSGRAVMLNGNFENHVAAVKLEVKYHRPTPCEEMLTVVGWVVKKSGKHTKAAGEIHREDGTVTASCRSVLVKLPEVFLKAWEEEKPYWKVYEDF